VVNQRAEARVGEVVSVLIERIDGDLIEGRAAHQGPEVDGVTYLEVNRESDPSSHRVGQYLDAMVMASDGADLIVRPLGGK
jgi:ribosomal protein S12 methylthiotransferase